MNVFFLAIHLVSIAAAAVLNAEQNDLCTCVESSKFSLTFHKDVASATACGVLQINNCSLSVSCSPKLSNISQTLAGAAEATCLGNNKAMLNISGNRQLEVTLECNDEDAQIVQVSKENLTLRIPHDCLKDSNASVTSPEPTQSTVNISITSLEPTQSTVNTSVTSLAPTQSAVNTSVTSLEPTQSTVNASVTSLEPTQSTVNASVTSPVTTQFSNSSLSTTEINPSVNTTHESETTTHSCAVSFKFGSALLPGIVALSILL